MKSRSQIIALFPSLFFSLCVFSQEANNPDPLKEAQARLAVAISRAESQFREQMKEFDEWSRKDPERAATALDNAERLVKAEPSLPEKRRTAMLDQISRKKALAASPKNPAGVNREAEMALAKSKTQTTQLSEAEKQQLETSRQLKEINRLNSAGKNAEANRRLGELGRKDANNPAVVAANQLAGTRGIIQQNKEFGAKYSSSMLAALREIEAAGVPIAGDMTFPDDWVEKSKRRSSGARMTEKEKAIVKALGSSMSVTMEGEQLKYFLDAMEKQLGIPLVIDKQALETAGIGLETPITVRAKNWTARSVLRKVFSDLGIAYIIRSEEVLVTTQETARETMITRSYYIGDLLPVFGNNSAAMTNPYLDPWTRMNLNAASQVQFAQTLSGIIESIKSQVDPNSWAPNGQGNIVFEPQSMSLIVKQTAEVHFMLGSTLR